MGYVSKERQPPMAAVPGTPSQQHHGMDSHRKITANHNQCNDVKSAKNQTTDHKSNCERLKMICSSRAVANGDVGNDQRHASLTNSNMKNKHNQCIALPLRPPACDTTRRMMNINQLCRAGLQPIYIYKPTFGKLPSYLKQRMMEAATEEDRQRAEQIRGQLLCQYVPGGERTAVLEVF